MLVYRDTLREALSLRERPGAIGLALSFEGARYYVFVSRQSREEVANSSVANKLKLHAQLLGREFTNEQYQERFQAILPIALCVATQNQVDKEGRHAEELMIERFDECVQNFTAFRGRLPAKAEVFLSHCPCQSKDPSASPPRMLAGTFTRRRARPN